MELRQLRIFLVCAQQGSFSRAASRLYISHSAVSREMAGLEASLGARLFIRDSRGVRLTAAGLEARESAVRLLGEADELCRRIKTYGTGDIKCEGSGKDLE